jgi:hypothetical protein
MADTKADNVTTVSDEEWETVAEESGSPIRFENVGDIFVGVFNGIRHIVPPKATKPEDEFDQLLFRDAEGNGRTINAGYKLLEAFGNIEVEKKVRITRVPDVPMNDPGKNDMKDYRVEVAR